jgi:hypothetical protein
MKRRSFCLWVCAALVVWQGLSTLASAAAVDKCLAKARDRARKKVENSLSRTAARRLLEIGAAACLHPDMPPDTAAFIGTVHADLARFGHDFLLGKLDGLAYRQARLDRLRKLRDWRDDVAWHQELTEGDADGDLVPDRQDRCAETPDGTPTDDTGCPEPVKIRPPGGSEALFRRQLKAAKTLHNESCKDAPEPASPLPLAWGRSLSGPGFKLVVAQVGGMPPGCELLYEIHFHFIEPTSAQVPSSKDVSVVFREGEDVNGDPTTAVFSLPAGVPLSPGRTAAFEAFFLHYQKVTWRVRAANGSARMSRWSPMVTQGPASGGIP